MHNKAFMLIVATVTVLALAGIIDISTKAEGAAPQSLVVYQNGKANHHPVKPE